MDSVAYYDNNAASFYERTINKDMSDPMAKFLVHLPKGGKILDAGCGVGRDTKKFLSLGFDVAAFDASDEMVKLAKIETQISVQKKRFLDLDDQEAFDAVWASASLLHVPMSELRPTLEKLHQVLLPSGTIYMSFKHGDGERMVGERRFLDMNQERFEKVIEGLFAPISVWTTKDTSQIAPSQSGCWFRFIGKKIEKID